jgi:hypothetical protein
LSAEASSTNASARRTRLPGARDESWAPEPDAGDAADQQGRRHLEPEVAEEHVAEGGRGHERDGLQQVGADELARPQAGVEGHRAR